MLKFTSATQTPSLVPIICHLKACSIPEGFDLRTIKAPEDVTYKDDYNLLIKGNNGVQHLYQFFDSK